MESSARPAYPSQHPPPPCPPSLFIFLRFWPKLACEHFRTLTRATNQAPVVEHPAEGEVAALRLFSLARRSLGFLRSVAIVLQMYGAALPAWWLIGVSTLEVGLMACAWRALAEWTRAPGSKARWDSHATLLLISVFVLTHGAGVGCLARPGGCGNLTALGVVLIVVNVAVLGWLAARPCTGACSALCEADDDGDAAAAAAAAENTPAIVRSRRGARLGKRYVYFCCKIAQPDVHEAPDPIAA
jgi:hypothetical protein